MNKLLDTSKIPKGGYCYSRDENGIFKVCPYWDNNLDLALESYKLQWHLTDEEENAIRSKFRISRTVEQGTGYCHYLELGDWMDGGSNLLWDQCKECGINLGEDES